MECFTRLLRELGLLPVNKVTAAEAGSKNPRRAEGRRIEKSVRFADKEVRLPEEYGGGTITIRLHGDESDVARNFNRTENIRPIPPTDPDFKCIYSRRNDSESINRGLDDTLWLSRAHSVGHGRQLLNLLGYP